jgi:murein DD-endopeptidase MepM/ murein hydrolase activator NlpD
VPEYTPTRRARVIQLALVVSVLIGATLSPAAIAAESDDIRSERDRVRAEAAAAAADLEPLEAEDAELEAAVAELTSFVGNQQARLDEVTQALAATESAIANSEQRLEDLDTQAALLNDQIRETVVTEFMGLGAGESSQMFVAESVNEANRRSFFFEVANRNYADAVDELRAVTDEVTAIEEVLEVDRARSVELQAAEQARLLELEAALDEQERLKAALDERISEFRSEVDALEASEANLEVALELAIIDEERALAQPPPAAAGDSTAAPSAAPGSSGTLSWPAGGTLTSRFGPRWGRNHNGIDVAAPTGSTVSAADSGTVISAGYNGGFGLAVLVDHGNGMVTVYGHHSSLSVSAGESVSRGQKLGAMGCTGSCTGPHVHFEVRIGGVAYDPLYYL